MAVDKCDKCNGKGKTEETYSDVTMWGDSIDGLTREVTCTSCGGSGCKWYD